MTTYYDFSALRQGDNIRLYDPERNKDAHLPDIDLDPWEEDERIPELFGTVMSKHRTVNFGMTLSVKLQDGTWETFYEDDDWKIDILNTPQNVLLDQHYTWKNQSGAWQVAVNESPGQWSYNGVHYDEQQLKEILPVNALRTVIVR
jgi:hypothetical protein